MRFVPGCYCCDCDGSVCVLPTGCGGVYGTGGTPVYVPVDHADFRVVAEDLTTGTTVYDELTTGTGPACIPTLDHHHYTITISKSRYTTRVLSWVGSCGDSNYPSDFGPGVILMKPADGYGCAYCCQTPVPNTLFLDDGIGTVPITNARPPTDIAPLQPGLWVGEASRPSKGCPHQGPDAYGHESQNCDPFVICSYDDPIDIDSPVRYSWTGGRPESGCGAAAQVAQCVSTRALDPDDPYSMHFPACVLSDAWQPEPMLCFDVTGPGGPCGSAGGAAYPDSCAPLHWSAAIVVTGCYTYVWPSGINWTVTE